VNILAIIALVIDAGITAFMIRFIRPAIIMERFAWQRRFWHAGLGGEFRAVAP
jgi:hypothetical protein